jgi:hypothetical protein
MSKIFVNTLICGCAASVAVSYADCFSQFENCALVYLAMILSALLTIGKTLETRP